MVNNNFFLFFSKFIKQVLYLFRVKLYCFGVKLYCLREKLSLFGVRPPAPFLLFVPDNLSWINFGNEV